MNSNYQNFKIYLIDNNSVVKEREILISLYQNHPKIDLLLYKENYGFTKAHLKLWEDELKNLNSEYIFLLNNDTIITPDTLENLINHAALHPEHFISAKMIDYYHRNQIDNLGHQLMSSGEILPIATGTHSRKHNSSFQNIGPCAGAGFYPLSSIRKIGFFDEFFDTGYEDAELGLRAKMNKIKCSCAINALVYHKGGSSIKKVFNTAYAIRTQRNILYTIFKLYPKLLLFLTTPFLILRYLIIILVSILILKWNYAIVITKSVIQFFLIDLSIALRKRINHQTTTKEVLGWMHSSVNRDFGNLFGVIFRGRKTGLEKYR